MLQMEFSISCLLRTQKAESEHEIIISRNGRLVARLVLIESHAAGKRLGVAQGTFEVPDDIDVQNNDVAAHFRGKACSRTRRCYSSGAPHHSNRISARWSNSTLLVVAQDTLSPPLGSRAK